MATVPARNAVNFRQMLPILGASTLGTAIEWYDFFLYGFLSATVFPAVFFPKLDPVAGIIASFTANFVGFAARPIGGAFFGWFGDRVGRKSTLIATLLLMGIATFLMGVLPGYATLGVGASVILAVLRFLQGAGVGGEWGGSVLLSLEYGDDRRRGFWASWPQTGVPIGLTLSALAVIVFKAVYPGEAFVTFGWRIPFLLSAILILIGLYIRVRILETPSFTKVKEENRVSKAPLIDVLRHHWREIVLTALIRSGEQAPFYIFITFILSYAGASFKGVSLNMSSNTLYTGLIVAGLLEFVAIPTFSHFSDIVGRKRWFLIGAVLMAAFAFPYFWLLGTKNDAIVIFTITISAGIFHAWLYGPEAAFISERFGTKLRYTGASLGYQLASITAGGPAPIIAVALVATYHSYVPIAIYMVIMCAITFISVFGLVEYSSKAAAEDVEEQPGFVATAD